MLDTTRRGAQRARVAAICELKALLVTAPVDLRDQLRGLTTAALVAKCSALRPPQSPRRGARRHQTGPEVDRPADQDTHRGDRPTRSGDPPAHQRRRPPAARPARRRPHHRRPDLHRLVPPRAMPQRGRVRRASAGSRPSKPPPGRQHATASTAAATATSTGHCTPSPSPAADTAPTPRPTSPKESARAKPHEKPGAASNATSPASSTDSYSTHQPPLDKHRSIGLLRRWLPKGTDLNIGPVRLADHRGPAQHHAPQAPRLALSPQRLHCPLSQRPVELAHQLNTYDSAKDLARQNFGLTVIATDGGIDAGRAFALESTTDPEATCIQVRRF